MSKNKDKKTTTIGGQAVIEGVMMRGKTAMATAVRAESGKILVESQRINSNASKNKFFKLPLIRGVVAFIDSLVLGTKTLTRSASVFGEEETTKFDEYVAKKTGANANDIATFIAVLLGVVLSVTIFFFLPQLITDLLPIPSTNAFLYSLVEGLVRILIFITYILLTTLIKDVKRTYMYHGAEHKTIACYESGKELTVENVKKCSRVHDRCGTTFMFLVMLISILVFSFVNYGLSKLGLNFVGASGKALRFAVKLLLLPFVSGLSYEILKLLAKTKSKWVIIFKAPGLLLQRLTTSEPSNDMIEVAITAFVAVLEMDEDQSIEPRKFGVFGNVPTLLQKVKKVLQEANVNEDSDAEWIVCRAVNVKRSTLNDKTKTVLVSEYDLAMKYAKERAKKVPLAYVFNDCEFYGYTYKVNKDVLIPRPETEELCKLICDEVNQNAKILDMCTGSGAIAITLNKLKGYTVTAVDVSVNALNIAKENAKNNLANVEFIESDMFKNVSGTYDVIVCNPPYIKTQDLQFLQEEVKKEPTLALDGGEDGLDFYRIIRSEAIKFLSNNGTIYMECGINQSQDIKNLFNASNLYKEVCVYKDVNGIDRIIKVVK